MGKFVVTKITDVETLKVGDELECSDYLFESEKKMVQFEYKSEEASAKLTEIDALPGAYFIRKTMAGFDLIKTEFTEQHILSGIINTKNVTEKVDQFFNKISVYEKYKIFPKRGILLYGVQGSGKSSSITEIIHKYSQMEQTMVLVWNTDMLESSDVKTVLKSLTYTKHDIKRLILVAEDLMGVEAEGRDYGSPSSLLSILDNTEKIYSVPTMIIATTNNPENFQSNIVNRPGRFDDKIHVGYPDADSRVKLMKFFSQQEDLSAELEDCLRGKSCSELTPAHLKEALIRSELRDITLIEALKAIREDSELAQKGFKEKRSLGMGGFLND
jgi:SpoVK/Ycf46/Vps4 family AAA+-type ATPase